jgi:hypothetical protein
MGCVCVYIRVGGAGADVFPRRGLRTHRRHRQRRAARDKPPNAQGPAARSDGAATVGPRSLALSVDSATRRHGRRRHAHAPNAAATTRAESRTFSAVHDAPHARAAPNPQVVVAVAPPVKVQEDQIADPVVVDANEVSAATRHGRSRAGPHDACSHVVALLERRCW